MTKQLSDHEQREQALDPRQSFIVQAPAGSGKTELLTQRFLKLLSCVNEPEEILAITFTKKAASEMRSRIRDALKRAQEEPLPPSAHEQKTWQLGKKALKQDLAKGWGLLTNPNRLRIKTIDSFNSLLTRQLPLLSQFGASPEIMDYPRALYREAVQTFLTHLEENLAWSQAIAQLLLHLDNNLLAAEELLVEMLSKRDHWLPHIAAYPISPDEGESQAALRQLLEANLRAVIEETLRKLKAAFPTSCLPDLLSLLHFACNNLKALNPHSTLLYCENLSALPGTRAENKAAWLGLAELLLTKEGDWRKNFDKNSGFPAAEKTKAKTPDLKALNKQKMKTLIEELSQHENLRQALVDLLYLPEASYSEAQWEILKALHIVLKIAVAQLNVVFRLAGKIDYTENALAALLALGREEAPTDLAFVLDYQLKHILVDEFQDTSSNQYELLKKLVHGWQPGDGRSLFLVGDPMQSIYRFREADVGLFLRARQQGLGPIPLKSLTLSLNFRSTPLIVDWINSHFNQVFPDYDDIASGAVSYTPSVANAGTESGKNGGVQLHTFLSAAPQAQTQGLIQLLREELKKNPQDKLAILVRSRNHLKALIPALKSAQLPYQAVEIDLLETRPLIQDLLALTRALLYPADPVAWLAILRAPWCGLCLNDLLILAEGRKQELIWQRLQQAERYSQLSPEGQQRLQRLLPILKTAMAEHHREELHHWVKKTWLALGGPACLETESDLQDADLFFGLLKKLTQNKAALGLKWASLEEALKQLYAQTTDQTDCRIQIMTIHNAKGLEFDTVILPHLEKGTGKNDKPLLTWLERPLINNTTALLLAPIHAVGTEEDPIYKHIRRQDKNKTQHEQGRLLYVAATRAKKNLHLCMSLETEKDGEFKIPPDSSMLKKLWPSIQAELQPQPPLEPGAVSENKEKKRYIKRLLTQWLHPLAVWSAPERPAHNKIQGFHLAQQAAPIIGTVVHYILQQISRWGFSWWETKAPQEQRAYLKLQLIKNGSPPALTESALEKVQAAILITLADPRGQWLLQERQEAQAELALTAVIEGKPKMLIIDRTFVDEQGLRWLIDYKTAIPESQSLNAFLQTQKQKYAPKMWEYHQALAALDPRPIRQGLYFPLIPAWCEWESYPSTNTSGNKGKRGFKA